LGHPFGAAFDLAYAGLEMQGGAGHRCWWPATLVSRTGRRQKTIVCPTLRGKQEK
jgi:hypothetical protein